MKHPNSSSRRNQGPSRSRGPARSGRAGDGAPPASAVALAGVLALATLAVGSPAVAAPAGPGAVEAATAAHHAGHGDPVGPGLYRLTGLDPESPSHDLAPLARILGNARFVGLGEATHTSGGFYDMKHRIIRFLVERERFRGVGFETSWVNAQTAGDYVATCEGSSDDAVNALTQVWRSTEVRDLLEWMCGWNASHPRRSDELHLYGFDIQGHGREYGESLIAFLDRLGFGSGHPWVEGVAACDGVVVEYWPFELFPEELYDQCQGALAEVWEYFDENRQQIVHQTSREDLGWARINLVSQQAWQELIFFLYTDFPRAYAARDRGMAYVAQAIPALRFPHGRSILWGHDGHVVKEGPTSYGLETLGTFLDRQLGRRYASVGLVAYETDVNWPAIGVCGIDLPFGDNPVEQVFHDTGEEYLLLDVDPRGPRPSFLDPETVYAVAGIPMLPAEHWDALVFLDYSPKMDSLAWPVCVE